ncbi:hypothetical protein B7P43_G12365 [Cryptotermes secundus]|uniref:MADF domain-containing protein n=1 Tax=Cryptotermes secundus TaxID=105785 RepID=A0A2J7QAY9_9NEOP|nr:uncharacterized protein LOC111868681 [Cryptotermes secundus]PNF25751.1 hypothetical protein B7P43_G12365 [Cryptotermes secundus]
MNEPVEDVMKRWRGLRDTFRKELNKYNFKRSGSGGDTSAEPKWPFFNHLRFLTDTVQPRNMSSSVPAASEDCIETTQSESNDAFSTPDMENTTSDPSRENDAPVNASPAKIKISKVR